MLFDEMFGRTRSRANQYTYYTDEDLKEIIREVDMKDGKLDGKVAAETPGTCPNCGQTLQKNKNICIYCGTEIEIEDVFQR